MRKQIPFPLQLLCALFVVFIFTFSRCEDDDGIGMQGCLFEVFDGNDQSGKLDANLSKPIRVRLRDSGENPRVGVSVEFSVESGEGQVSDPVALTGPDGVAQTTWRLGNNCGQQRIKARITEGQCNGRELIITASADTANIAGFDYPVVVIGGNCWMAQNLRWNIPLYSTVPGAIVIAPNHPSATPAERGLFGRLYTWLVGGGTFSTHTPCIGGWRLPTNQDWDNLIRAYNANWPDNTNTPQQLLYPNGQSGFNAHVQGGGGSWANVNGGRDNFENAGFYWSATRIGDQPWRYRFRNNTIQRETHPITNLYSCRCVKQ